MKIEHVTAHPAFKRLFVARLHEIRVPAGVRLDAPHIEGTAAFAAEPLRPAVDRRVGPVSPKP